MLYHSHTIEETLQDLRSSSNGLHHIYAQSRLRKYGPNKLRMTRRSLADVILDPFVDIYVVILIIALGLSLLIQQPAVTILLTCVVLINIGLRYIQTAIHERLLRRLERIALGKIRVHRDGIDARLDAEELVPGDIVIISKGDRIPADGRLIQAAQLHLNEYQLSGNNEPIEKHTAVVHSESARDERTNMVYRGAYVTSGTGVYAVTATGNHTEYGKMTTRLARIEKRSTLQQKIAVSTSKIVALSLSISAALLLMALSRGTTIPEIIEFTISIIIAAVPAMLPVALSVLFAYGLKRLAAERVLLRSLQSIEYTSMLTTLVSDKTGMLTHEKLQFVAAWSPEHTDSKFEHALLQTVVASSDERDAVDTAILKHAGSTHHNKTRPVTSYPFNHSHHMSGSLWHTGDSYTLAIKGAPEKILRLSKLTDSEHEKASHQLQKLTGEGYVVLAIATYSSDKSISSLQKLPKRHPLTFVGLVAFRQAVRPTVKSAVAALGRAGVSTRIITGDHTESAYVLARKLGIASSRPEALDTRRLSVMNDSELTRVTRETSVYARATPDQKYRLLSALKHSHVVGMTGSGTDDIPSLVHAHIGITTSRSSVLARDAADLVLLDDQFASLPRAVQISRTIMGNIRRVFFYTMTTNIAEMAILITVLLLALPIALTPAHILWLNLVTYSILVVALAVEPDSRNIMTRRPVSPRAGILPKYLALRMCVLAITISFIVVALFVQFSAHYDLGYAQAIVLHTLIILQMLAAVSARSDHTSTFVRFRTWSPAIYGALIVVCCLYLLTFYTPLGTWLGVMTPALDDLISTGLIASGVFILVSETLKIYSRRRVREEGRSYE